MRRLKTARRSEIVGAALELAAERGLPALSMRGVAARLGLTPMALYGYFRSKDDLLDGITTHLLTLLPEPAADLDPLTRLRELAGGVRAVARAHPAVAGLLFTRPAAGETSLVPAERVYQALLDLGVPDTEVPRLERLLSTFVLGFVLSEVDGRFAASTRLARSRRVGLGPADLPAHHRLGAAAHHADCAAEFTRDLDDLLAVVRAAAS
ncbi:TetR/AcrR family transcriptional regulator [Amycolatopsis rhabdoformis]|uniref:TetR/AcrR family transcriptional regulator n=1 Tax=Amycolatopsis rhabdoformis TaxID=1448059 RepID=A0ABZ1I9X1_9PSEU|nr:TetR/AcrR family transcriptional regulator [Amycolatopsis rhabdoformis]WSE31275.1 TetR/AcrR family transcriptional regulator [Amycolatopsis rhabdoformis]